MGLKSTMSDDMYQKIKEKIINREIKPGEKINQANLAKELKTSRTPIVKALYRLASEGIVDNIPNRGFYIHELTLYEVRDLFYLRQSLDRLIVANIIQKNNIHEIKELRKLFDEFIDCEWNKEQYQKYWEKDKLFHNKLIRMCDNQWVKKIEESFQVYGRVYKEGLLREPSQTLSEHFAIIDAIESENLEKAERVIMEHTQATIEEIERVITQLLALGFDPSVEHARKITKENKILF